MDEEKGLAPSNGYEGNCFFREEVYRVTDGSLS